MWLPTLPFGLCNSPVYSEFKTWSVISYTLLLVSSLHTPPLKKENFRLQLSCTSIAQQLAHNKQQAPALPCLPWEGRSRHRPWTGFRCKLEPFHGSKTSAKLQQELPVPGQSSPLCGNSSRAVHGLQLGCHTGSPPGQVSRANKSSDWYPTSPGTNLLQAFKTNTFPFL